jgi:deazaflavin-dependent oxidoreductase (nitroreductase family)
MPSILRNFFMKVIINSPFHSLLGESFAVITFKGRKSGKHYSTPVNMARVDGEWTIVSMRERTWWRNLRGGRKAQLRVAGQRLQVRGKVMEDSTEVLAGLTNYFVNIRDLPGTSTSISEVMDSQSKKNSNAPRARA